MIPATHPMARAVPPRFVEDIYTPDEIELLFGIVRNDGPWRLIAAQHFNTAEEYLAVAGAKNRDTDVKLELSDLLTPTFRGYLGDQGVPFIEKAQDLYYNTRLLDMIKTIHGGKFAFPTNYTFNVRAPAHSYDAGHLDGTSFRGMTMQNTPLWLIGIMAKSGLFEHWEFKTGQVIAYFYNSDVDGGFTFWPDGPDRAPQRFAAPFHNSGLLMNAERIFHRGEASGPVSKRSIPGLQLNSVVSGDGADEWVIRNDGQEIARYHNDDMRLLFHYSAYVFDDLADVKRYLDHTDNLTRDRVFEMFIDDLDARGVSYTRPSDPMNDEEFKAVLARTYAMAPSSYPEEAPLDVPGKSSQV
ncbi:hypothetical protein ACFWPH_32680 [Nocardia sp. NPDC058499]|uniref:hypothetical protein n=1 Tax=Nocardia sp. NPDC058499 TaxID=3346530 RepID=UPI00364A323B